MKFPLAEAKDGILELSIKKGARSLTHEQESSHNPFFLFYSFTTRLNLYITFNQRYQKPSH